MTGEPYKTAEDTLLLADVIEAQRARIALEIGVGSGFVTEQLARNIPRPVGTDISAEAIRETRDRLKQSRLFHQTELLRAVGAACFRPRSFDLVAFNPPYLPSRRTMNEAVDGGQGGIQRALEILRQVKEVLKPSGTVLLVISSLSDYPKLLGAMEQLGYEIKRIRSKKLFFEELHLIEAVKP